MRRSIVSVKKIYKGDIIKESFISFKRPSGGIPPKQINEVIGRRLKKDIESDQQLNWSDFE